LSTGGRCCCRRLTNLSLWFDRIFKNKDNLFVNTWGAEQPHSDDDDDIARVDLGMHIKRVGEEYLVQFGRILLVPGAKAV